MGFFKNIITVARRSMGTTAPMPGIVDATHPDWPASPTAAVSSESTETPATTWEAGNLDSSEPQALDRQSAAPDEERGRSGLQAGHVNATQLDRPASLTAAAPLATTKTSATTWQAPDQQSEAPDREHGHSDHSAVLRAGRPRSQEAAQTGAELGKVITPASGSPQIDAVPITVESDADETGLPPTGTHTGKNPPANRANAPPNPTATADVTHPPSGFKPTAASNALPESPAEVTQAASPKRAVNRPATAGSQPMPESRLPPPFIPGREIPFLRSPGVRLQPPEPAAPQVQIGQIDVIVEAPTAAKAPSDRPRQTVDLASRLYLRGL